MTSTSLFRERKSFAGRLSLPNSPRRSQTFDKKDPMLYRVHSMNRISGDIEATLGYVCLCPTGRMEIGNVYAELIRAKVITDTKSYLTPYMNIAPTVIGNDHNYSYSIRSVAGNRQLYLWLL